MTGILRNDSNWYSEYSFSLSRSSVETLLQVKARNWPWSQEVAWIGLESGVILARPFLYQEEQSWFRSELTTYPCISYPVMVRTWELFLSSVAPCYLVLVSKAYFVQFETETQKQRRSPCNSRFSDILGCDHLCLLSPICSSLSHHTVHL